MRIDLNRGWSFTEQFTDGFAHGEIAPDTVTVDLPHSCKTTPFDYFDESIYQMLCGYRKTLSVPEKWAGKRVFLCVGAAAHTAKVYVDGKLLGEHRSGYTAFRTELTSALEPGRDALIAISVDSREDQDIPPFGFVIDYMTYGGIYREVWLEITERAYISDVFVKPELSGRVVSEVTVDGEMPALAVRQMVLDGENAVARAEGSAGEELVLTVPDPEKWSADSPKLYTMVTELLSEGRPVSEHRTRFGFRSAQFRADGFYLNGEKLKLRGLDRHQSYPYVGYAMPASVQRFDADVLRYELGCNCVRTSHYPQSQHFIDRCDELGLMVFTEIPGWQHIGDEEWKDIRNRKVG